MKTFIKYLLAAVILTVPFYLHASLSGTQSPFDVIWDEAPVAVRAGDPFELKITVRAPSEHYLYADETDVDFTSFEGLIVNNVKYPKPSLYTDPYMGKKVKVYKDDVAITIIGRVPESLKEGARELVARLSFRGCSPKLCFRPEEREISFNIDVTAPLPKAEPSIRSPLPSEQAVTGDIPSLKLKFRDLIKTQDFADLLDRGVLFTMVIVFLAGVLTSLTPCVWPVIPVILLFVGIHPHKKFVENLLLALSLACGLVLVYAVLGVAAVVFGKNLGFLFQQRIFLALVVLFFIAMSLSMFGVFDLRMPRRWQHRLHELGGEGYRGAFLAGMGTGLVASPCAGPVLAALLGHVTLQRDYTKGFIYLVVYGFGMSLLFVILGASYGELAGKLKSGPWMVWVRRLLGILLLFPAAFYMGSLFRWSSMPAVPADKPKIEWIKHEPDALRFASESGRPLMIEFGAEWCPPCRALETDFFRKFDIVNLSYRMVPLRVDATFETKEVRRLIDKYKVIGWPSVIFLDSNGKEYEYLRVNSYDTDAIEKGMKEAVVRTNNQ